MVLADGPTTRAEPGVAAVPCSFAGCGAVLRPFVDVEAHNAAYLQPHLKAEHAARVAAEKRVDVLTARLALLQASPDNSTATTQTELRPCCRPTWTARVPAARSCPSLACSPRCPPSRSSLRARDFPTRTTQASRRRPMTLQWRATSRP